MGIITPKVVFSGLSDSTVVLFAGMFVVGAALFYTGQIPTTTGSKAAVVPVLDKNADIVAVTTMIASIKPFSLVPA